MKTKRTAMLIFTMAAVAVLVLAAACERKAVAADTDANGATASTSLSQAAEYALALASSYGAGGQQLGISVTGTGTGTATPDLAQINLGVQANADTVAEALDQANGSLAAMLVALDGLGIDESDTQTRHFNVQPMYAYPEVRRCVDDAENGAAAPKPLESVPAEESSSQSAPSAPAVEYRLVEEKCFTTHERVLVGYEVANQLTVMVRDLDNVGPVIDGVAAAGGDLVVINGVNFMVENTAELTVQARDAAVKAALEQAQQFAQLTGVEVGKLVHISQSGGFTPTVRAEASFDGAMAASAAPTPIRSGELEITVSVQASFAIQ